MTEVTNEETLPTLHSKLEVPEEINIEKLKHAGGVQEIKFGSILSKLIQNIPDILKQNVNFVTNTVKLE